MSRSRIDQKTFIKNDKDATELALIPEGEFLAGEKEKFKVYLPSFLMALHPVTNAQYARFLNEVQPSAKELKEWVPNDPIGFFIHKVGNIFEAYNGMEDHPVVNVSWEGAQSYCEWAGLRLPRELEWEKGSRGSDGLEYPWGNDWEEGRNCWWAGEDWKNQITCSVWNYPEGRSPWGLYQMVGNVSEWCEDWYDYKAYDRYHQGDFMPSQRAGSKNILVVDDEMSIRLCYKEELENKGYNVLIASTGKEALEILGIKVKLDGDIYRVMPRGHNEILESLPYVNLVISDISHPEINGLELLRLIKETWLDLPFILNTSYSVFKKDYDIYAADEYLVKSINFKELIQTVRKYINPGPTRVVRGGSYCEDKPEYLRCGYRDCLSPERANPWTSFRCAKTSS